MAFSIPRVVRRIPPLYVAYSVSLVVGLTQLLLAWQGNLLRDSIWIRPADHVQAPWFGYITTFHWWVSYVTCVPVIVACSVHGLTTMWLLYKDSKILRRALVVGVVAGVVLSSVLVGREVVRSLTVEPTEWAQWNDLRTHPSDPGYSWHYRVALCFLGYFHYFVAYALFMACVASALLVFGMLRVPPSIHSSTRSKDVSRTLVDILLSVRIIVAGALFYLVLLRSSKVSMWLTFMHKATSLDKIGNFLSNAQPYFEVAREGILVNILLGLLWSGICIVIHMLAGLVSDSSNQSGSATLGGVLTRLKAGYELVGSLWSAFFGVCLVGIVLPPPSGEHFLAVVGIGIGGYLARKAFRGAL